MTDDTDKPALVLKRKAIFIWTVLLAGWLFDFLFWGKVAGISVAIYFVILLAAGFFLARQQNLSPARSTLYLLIPIVCFAVMTAFRLEPMTIFFNIVGALALMGLLAHSFLGGKWWQYTFKDYLTGAFFLGLDTVIRPVAVFTSQPKTEVESSEMPAEKPANHGLRRSLAVLRGVLIALPIVLVFAGILAEADPIFDQVFGEILDFFRIENLGEYIFRAFLISFIAYLLLGVILHAFLKDHDDNLSQEESRWLPRFLGITEAAIVLGSVNLLFLIFVVIQFQYFFGGESNINLAGFTYAEYARRGFGELVTVAVFSLLLFMGLSFLTKKEEMRSQRTFSVLGIVLFGLVTVILVSSFQRLLLYEQAYGFTRLRAYTHIFIIWLGVLLLAVSLLELARRHRAFALAALLAGLGFITTLNIVNIDALIVRQNVGRLQQGETLDITYLASLSEDAVPALTKLYQSTSGESEKDAIAGAIACHAAINDQYDYANDPNRNYTWQSFHFSRYRAGQAWEELEKPQGSEEFLVLYKDEEDSNDYTWQQGYVIVAGEEVPCGTGYSGWD